MADITIQNLRVAPSLGPRVPTTLRAYPRSSFLLNDADHSAVTESSPHNSGPHFKSMALTLEGTLYYGAADFTLPSTTDSPDNPGGARWGLAVMDANGRFMYWAAGLESFALDHTDATQDAEDIRAYNLDGLPPVTSGNRTVNGNLTVTGDGSFGGDVHIEGGLQVDGPITSDDTLNVNDDVNVAGNVTATGFAGDGSLLTGVTPVGGSGGSSSTGSHTFWADTDDNDAAAIADTKVGAVTVARAHRDYFRALKPLWLPGYATGSLPAGAEAYLAYDTDRQTPVYHNGSGWQLFTRGVVDVTSYGATGDGTTDDTTAINLAIAALNAAGGGVLYLPFGDYKVTAALTTITVPFQVRGDGHANTNGGTWITRIFTTSTTANLFTVTSAKGKFRDIAIVNDAATAPTAGVGILVTTPSLPTPTPAELGNQIDFENIYVGFFYIDVDIESGAIWHMTGSTISHPVHLGMRVNNLNYLDAGDWTINQTTFEQAVYQSESALLVESSGGGRITNVKVNGAGGASGDLSFNNPFHFNLSTTASTGILLISNTSIENSRGDGIKIQNGYHLICISNCQFGLYGNTTGELIHLSNVKNVTIDNIVAQQSNATPANLAFRIENSENVQIGQYSLKYYSFAVSFDGTYVPEGTGDTPKFLTTASFATLQNGWSNLAGHAPSGFGYFNGEVHLRGAIQGGTTTSGTLLFTLPVGFRPTYAHTFAVHNLNSSTHGTAIIEVATNGQVKVYGAAGSTLLSFNGVRFVP